MMECKVVTIVIRLLVSSSFIMQLLDATNKFVQQILELYNHGFPIVYSLQIAPQ